MNLDEVIFIDNLPTLDLHGLDRETSRVLINDFINDNFKCKNRIIVIIHGNGEYILRDTTRDVLSKNKKVKEFKLFIYNTGCTLALLDLN